MSTKLRVAPDLALPLQAATETFTVLGKRGTGKSYTTSVVVEELVKVGQQVVVIDPTDVWWGLRSSADGKGPGLPVVIFGGPHGDLPLVEQDAEVIARAIIEQGFSCVLSLRHLSKQARLRFAAPLFEQLYLLKAERREPLMLVVDEADRFAPQKLMKGQNQERSLGALDEIVRMGRSSGFGVMLLTQRSAVISKDVISQTEVLVCTRTVSPQDIAAVDAWISEHDVEEKRDEFVASLPSLPLGDAWWWSPGWLEVFKVTRVRAKETFDSFYTPKVGEKPRVPKRLAEIDLEALKAQLARSIEQAKADDPKALRAEIARLNTELQRAKKAGASQPAGKGVVDQTAVDRAVQRAVADSAREAERRDREQGKTLNRVAGVLAKVGESLHSTAETLIRAGTDLTGLASSNGNGARTAVVTRAVPVERTRLTPVARVRPTPPARPAGDRPALAHGEQRILDALAELEATGTSPATRDQVGVVASLNLSGGTGSAYVGHLGDLGLVHIPSRGRLALTDLGRAAAAPVEAALTNAEMLRRALAKLNGGERRILEYLASIYPDEASRADVGTAVRLNLSGGTGSAYVGKLTTLTVVEIPAPGLLRASDKLFPEGA